ncbi:VOC family protein [Nesterenkonia ebinurensis]|uniref:hypothetical protein n=1 Tax=Nesterenkonia ebinurensis TaxID=2608252 RepID=UPI00168B22ED|nr:hypothetical protein [Nesterenkonia ebinurensis]
MDSVGCARSWDWEKFAPDAEISTPLEAAHWDPKDKFGVEWMFIVGAEVQADGDEQ